MLRVNRRINCPSVNYNSFLGWSFYLRPKCPDWDCLFGCRLCPLVCPSKTVRSLRAPVSSEHHRQQPSVYRAVPHWIWLRAPGPGPVWGRGHDLRWRRRRRRGWRGLHRCRLNRPWGSADLATQRGNQFFLFRLESIFITITTCLHPFFI